MAKVTLRGLATEAVEGLKQEARRSGISMNRLLVRRREEGQSANPYKPREYDDLDHLFGTLDEQEFQRITQAVAEQRKIDLELWGHDP